MPTKLNSDLILGPAERLDLADLLETLQTTDCIECGGVCRSCNQPVNYLLYQKGCRIDEWIIKLKGKK